MKVDLKEMTMVEKKEKEEKKKEEEKKEEKKEKEEKEPETIVDEAMEKIQEGGSYPEMMEKKAAKEKSKREK